MRVLDIDCGISGPARIGVGRWRPKAVIPWFPSAESAHPKKLAPFCRCLPIVRCLVCPLFPFVLDLPLTVLPLP
jgi:hypothetical protein